MEGISEGLGSVDAAVTPVGSHKWCLRGMRNVSTFRCVDKSQALHILDLGLSPYL